VSCRILGNRSRRRTRKTENNSEESDCARVRPRIVATRDDWAQIALARNARGERGVTSLVSIMPVVQFTLPTADWPYLPSLQRVVLALAIGLFIGFERQRRHKEAGLRTFAFVALTGVLGGLIGDNFAILALLLVGLLVTLLNLAVLRANGTAELTTSAALIVTGFAGVLVGQGHTLVPAAVAVITTALLAWKEPLAGFSLGLSEAEVRSAVLLAILAIVVYPALPKGAVDPYGLLRPRSAWITVILIAGIGFVNYVLWKVYGEKGVAITGFLGGLVNSTVTVGELAGRVRQGGPSVAPAVYQGIVLATAAMLARNALLIALLALPALMASGLAFILMLAATALFAWFSPNRSPIDAGEGLNLELQSPFSLTSALKYGAIFLALQIGGELAQQRFGEWGLYATSLFGGMVSSASAVAAAATLAANGTVSAHTAGVSAVIASLLSIFSNWPLVMLARDRGLTRRLGIVLAITMLLGIAGLVGQRYWSHS
jgi:uncharacterized membrane protein (DUF4010 family)